MAWIAYIAAGLMLAAKIFLGVGIPWWVIAAALAFPAFCGTAILIGLAVFAHSVAKEERKNNPRGRT